MSVTAAFAPAPIKSQRTSFAPRMAKEASPEVDSLGNNIAVKNLLTAVEGSGLLSEVANVGLLSKAEESGLSLTQVEKILALTAENPDVLILLEAAGPDAGKFLPTVTKLVDVAPAALPLLASLIQIPESVLLLGAVASLGAAGGIVVLVPDDTVLSIAAQTTAVGIFAALGAASAVGASVLSFIRK